MRKREAKFMPGFRSGVSDNLRAHFQQLLCCVRVSLSIVALHVIKSCVRMGEGLRCLV